MAGGVKVRTTQIYLEQLERRIASAARLSVSRGVGPLLPAVLSRWRQLSRVAGASCTEPRCSRAPPLPIAPARAWRSARSSERSASSTGGTRWRTKCRR
eukprot:6461119-Pyramimonas_sp.AAC.2